MTNNINDFNVNIYDENDWNTIDSILKSEDFIEKAKRQHGSYELVDEQEIVLPQEIIGANDLANQDFINEEITILKERYPELSETKLMDVATMCSRHWSSTDADIDRDICVAIKTDGIEEEKEVYIKALSNLKMDYTNFIKENGVIAYDSMRYSENQVALMVFSLLQKHLLDSKNQLLTWGEARLALDQLCKIKQEKHSSIMF